MRSRLEKPGIEAEPNLHEHIFPLPSSEIRPRSSVEPSEFVCVERVGEVTRRYTTRKPSGIEAFGKAEAHERLSFSETGTQKTPLEYFRRLCQTSFLPDGFPDSVDPSYLDYMRWRAVMYFFGGAMSVFTTRSLLHSLGMAKGAKAASGALAVNWVIKDGAGRLGKMMFARQGKKFDADLKQMRLASSMLMGLGAGLELSTVAAPRMFLPLACAANVLKNIGAVTNTSTRAPIYKVFARKENLGDITAKGESISNMADLMGTGFGILLARRNPSIHAAFCSLALGYVVASYNEIRSVQLPTLNKSRFSVAAKKFLETGAVPSVADVSRLERILAPPWATDKPFEIGVKVSDAFEDVEELRLASELCDGERFLVNFKPSQRKAYVVLKEGASGRDVLKGAFRAQLMLHHLKWRKLAQQTQLKNLAGTQGNTELSRSKMEGGVESQPCDLVLDMSRSLRVNCWEDEDEWNGLAVEAPLATLRQNWQSDWLRRNARERARQHALTSTDVGCALLASKGGMDSLFEEFVAKAQGQGWVMAESLLNPGEARLLSA